MFGQSEIIFKKSQHDRLQNKNKIQQKKDRY